jgi:uncharacterized protein YbjT (DUF2867 family)
MNNIALTAPTGKVGTAVLALARERKLPIRALARDTARVRAPAGAAVSFDFSDRSTYARALEAVDTLILVSPSTPKQIEVDSAVVDAARAAGVTHIVRLSGAGAEGGGGRFAEQHRAIDRYVGANTGGATIVRATWAADGLVEAYRFVRAGGTAATTDDVRRVAGRGPVDFATWARKHASAFLAKATV